MTSRAPPAMRRADSGLQKQKGGWPGGEAGDACLIARARRPLLLPASLTSLTRQSWIPNGNESFRELESVQKSVDHDHVNLIPAGSPLTLLSSVALETSRAGMEFGVRVTEQPIDRRRPRASAGGVERSAEPHLQN